MESLNPSKLKEEQLIYLLRNINFIMEILNTTRPQKVKLVTMYINKKLKEKQSKTGSLNVDNRNLMFGTNVSVTRERRMSEPSTSQEKGSGSTNTINSVKRTTAKKIL